jgi:predicted nuclease with TOPRIM domain
MNRTLLLIIVDFLFLNLIALTRWEKSEPVRTRQPPVTELSANAATKDQDLVAEMRDSLTDEKAQRDELAKKLAVVDAALDSKSQSLTQLQAEKANLSSQLTASQLSAEDLAKKFAAASQEETLNRDQLAQLKRELDAKSAEAARQKAALDQLAAQQAEAQKQIENLRVSVGVAEQEKAGLRAQAATLQGQVAAERSEREKVEAQTTELAQGVGQLAQSSGALTKEIRDNRPISANVLFNDFLSNRVKTSFTATRKGVFGKVNRAKDSNTIFVTDGKNVYALLHIEDTIFSYWENPYNWDSFAIGFDRPPNYHSTGAELDFLAADPRVAVVPVDASQVSALGAKVYPLAVDPFKFPDAVLINGGGRGYGEVNFKLDAAHPGYVKVDNRLMKRIFGDFAPSRGDLVLSRSGELLGIMVNSDFCVLLKDFTPDDSIKTGADTTQQLTANKLNGLIARIHGLDLPLQ